MAEVPISLLVLGQQQKVVCALLAVPFLVLDALRSDVSLDAQQRLDPCLFGLKIELHDAKHDAVIGDRERVHLHLLSPSDHLRDPIRTVKQRIFGVVMDVNE